jgi:hypothetical protein
MQLGRAEVERLADRDMLTDATLARCGHLGRFYEAVANAMPNPNLKVGDLFNEDELQRIWKETADPDADIGRCPPLH